MLRNGKQRKCEKFIYTFSSYQSHSAFSLKPWSASAWREVAVRTDNNRLFQKTHLKDTVCLLGSLLMKSSLHLHHLALSISHRLCKVSWLLASTRPLHACMDVLWGLQFPPTMQHKLLWRQIGLCKEHVCVPCDWEVCFCLPVDHVIHCWPGTPDNCRSRENEWSDGTMVCVEENHALI